MFRNLSAWKWSSISSRFGSVLLAPSNWVLLAINEREKNRMQNWIVSEWQTVEWKTLRLSQRNRTNEIETEMEFALWNISALGIIEWLAVFKRNFIFIVIGRVIACSVGVCFRHRTGTSDFARISESKHNVDAAHKARHFENWLTVDSWTII